MAIFTQKIREQNKSLILTIPSNVVKLLKLKNDDFCEVDIAKIKKSNAEKRGRR